MKVLFFLTLLANLVFFLWQYNAGAFHPNVDKVTLASAKPKQIWLLSELKKNPPSTPPATQNLRTQTVVTAPSAVIKQATQNTALSLVTSTMSNTATTLQAPEPAITPNPTKTTYCYQIDGFANKTVATQWGQKNLAGGELQKIQENQPVVADYLVHYPSATVSEQKKAMAMLEAQDITEFFVINQGEFKGAISLGVFKNESRAINAQQVLIRQGIHAKVAKRYKNMQTVSAQIKTEKTKPQLLAALTGLISKPKVKLSRKCH